MSATDDTSPYELLYWPGIPGRGEFIRLAFEVASVSYRDVSNEQKDGEQSPRLAFGDTLKASRNVFELPEASRINAILAMISPDSTGADGNPPVFAPPALRVRGEGKNGTDLVIYQTPSILCYLGDKLDLAGDHSAEKAWIHSHALTALDLNNEAHDTHHPLSVADYYEDQKEEALKKAGDFRSRRLPKYFGFFERVLDGNKELGQGKFLVGGKLSYADTTLWHVLNGLQFAFPKEMAARMKEYPSLFTTFYPGVRGQDGLKDYLTSGRRLPFSEGIFRHYPELDRQ